MKKDIIKYVEWDETRSLVLEPDAYRFDPKRPAKWLQRLCLWVLRKLHCHNYQETVAYTTHVITLDTVFDRVLQSQENLMKRNYQEPHLLFIGAEDFAELMGNKKMRQYFRFDVPYMYNRTFLNMEVHVVPWMKGVLGVPKRA